MDPTVVVDGIDYAIHFQGFDAPLEVLAPSGARVCLPPWSYRQHLDALRECVLPGGGGLQLDSRAFARRVLHDAQAPATLQAELTPLALWWAAGGGETQAAIAEGEWRVLGAVRVRLRPWSGGARFAALSQSLHQDGERTVLDLAVYLDAMVRASVVAIDPSIPLAKLNAAATVALLHAVVALNVSSAETVEQDVLESPQAARITLRLCRALGWTPSQVWATPAPEIDRLLALLDRLETPSAPAGPQGLARYPDAVVIQIEDDG